MDFWVLPLVGLGLIILGSYLLVRLWRERKGRPALIFVVVLMVGSGVVLGWPWVGALLGK